MPTFTTVPLLILIVVLWRMTRGNVLAIVVFTAIFNAASSLNFGALGVAPWLTVLALCIPIKLSRGEVRKYVVPGINRVALNFFLSFLAYAAFSGMTLPVVFAGISVVRVLDAVPLSWGIANVSQLCYLAAAAVVFLLTLTSTREELEVAVQWYVRGCIVGAFLGMYQLANAAFHVPYPSDVFYSNPGHVIFPAYRIGGIWRINSTFTEASDMAGSLIGGMGILCWDLVTKPLKISRLFYAILLMVTMVMSLSTTGYLCLAVMVVGGAGLYAGHLVVQGKIGALKVIIGLLVVLGGTTLFTLDGAARDTVAKVISSVVLDKQQTDSYKSRTESHVNALETLKETYYVGSGWGSMRASGMVYTLLAAVGIPGLVLFGAGYLALFLPLLRRRTSHRLLQRDDLLERALFAMTLLLCGMTIAGSEPAGPALWFLFGTAIVAAAPSRERQSEVQRSRSGYHKVLAGRSVWATE